MSRSTNNYTQIGQPVAVALTGVMTEIDPSNGDVASIDAIQVAAGAGAVHLVNISSESHRIITIPANTTRLVGWVGSVFVRGSGTATFTAYQSNIGAGTAAGTGLANTFSQLQTLSSGVNFGQTASLTYYDQGTWTPSVTCATPGNLAITSPNVSGKYTRIGDMVFFEFTFNATLTFTTASGELRITGLPFPSNSAQPFGGGNLAVCIGASTSNILQVGNNVSYIVIAVPASGGTVNISALTSGAAFYAYGQGFYKI